MALQITKTTEHGIALTAAYVRIVSFSGDLTNISVTTVTHADAAARTNGDREVDSKYFNLTAPDSVPTGGIVQWCYNQLKVLPEFTGYVDV